MKRFYSILFAIMMMFTCMFTSCDDVDGGGLTFQVEPKMEVEYSEYFGYTATITGVVVNNGIVDLDYADVEFSIYDESGNNLGTALDNINNLKVGDTWRFSANLFDYSETRPARFEFVGFTSW